MITRWKQRNKIEYKNATFGFRIGKKSTETAWSRAGRYEEDNYYEEKIIKNILNKIDKNCFKNLYFHKDISSMLFEGLTYRGIVYLLKERIERDGKI